MGRHAYDRVHRSILAVLLTGLLLSALHAQSGSPPHLWMIAVGVGSYIQPYQLLVHAADDAYALGEAFNNARPDGTTSVIALTSDMPDEEYQPLCANLRSQLEKVKNQVGPNDTVVFYFCGHGIENNGEQYLLMKDANVTSDQETLNATTIKLDWLRDRLAQMPCRARLLLLDTCRETIGDLQRSAGVNDDSLPASAQYLAAGSYLNSPANTVSATIYSCSQDEKTYHGSQGSYFNRVLIEGILGKAVDQRGQITIASLARYIESEVPDLVRTDMGSQHAQHPVLVPKNGAEAIVLRPAPDVIAIPDAQGRYGKTFVEIIRDYLTASHTIKQVESAQLSAALSQLQLQDSGITDPQTAAKIGKITNARYVLVTECTDAPSDQICVSSRLLVVETAEVVPGVTAMCTIDPTDVMGYRYQLQALAAQLLDEMQKVKGLTTANFDRVNVLHANDDLRAETGSIEIRSTPPGAQVVIGGAIQRGVTPMTVKGLRAGKMNILLTREGYQDQPVVVEIKPHLVSKTNVSLSLLQAAISVKTDPIGARVSVDGNYVGATTAPSGNLTIPGLTLGVHKLLVQLPHYHDVAKEIILTQANKTEEVNLTMTGLPGSLVVSTVPKGATVTVDGNVRGTSLLSLPSIAPGSHTIQVELSGYYPDEKAIEIAPADGATVTFDLREAKEARLRLETTPRNLRIHIRLNDQDLGERVCPATLVFSDSDLHQFTDGQVHLEISCPGYQPLDVNETLTDGTDITRRLTLEKITRCSLLIHTAPSDVHVTLSGGLQDWTDMSGGDLSFNDLPPGRYQIVLSKFGYRTQRRSINLRAGDARELSCQLHIQPVNNRSTTSLVGNIFGELLIIGLIAYAGHNHLLQRDTNNWR